MKQISVINDTSEVLFKLRNDTNLSRVMNAYNSRQGKYHSFEYNDSSVNNNDTPYSLNMEDGDVILARECSIPISIKPTGEQISISIFNGTSRVSIKLRKDTELDRTMIAYCSRQGLHRRNVLFFYNGEFIEDYHTPEFLSMENNDIILCTIFK